MQTAVNMLASVLVVDDEARQLAAAVLSNKCDVNEEAKDRLFDATEADEGRPLDVGWQKQASNQAVRLGFKRPWS